MDSGDEMEEGEVPSSPSDFYGSDAPASAAAFVPLEEHAPEILGNESPNTYGPGNGFEDDDSDGSSEMDLSSDSGLGEDELPPAAMTSVAMGTPAQKRKASDVETDPMATRSEAEGQLKKRKLSSAGMSRGSQPVVAGLTPEIWQQVFLRLTPAELTRCLRVCKAFNHLLTGTKALPANGRKAPNPYEVRILDSETIWSQSRRNCFPSIFPRPLKRCTEVQMLQLLTGKTCQFCGRLPASLPNPSYFNAGPGPEGVRIVWAFGLRSCGRCLQANAIRDVDILLSAAAALRQGLPYAFITPDLHLIPDMTRQQPGGIPAQLRANKVYYRQDVEDIEQQFEDAKGLGDAAADEWRKGLPTIGREVMADAARWEKWESQVQQGYDLGGILRDYDLSSFPRYVEEAQSKSNGVGGVPLAPSTDDGLNIPQNTSLMYGNGLSSTMEAHTQYRQPFHTERPQRQLHEVEEDRQRRKADIERRCMDLEPPLRSNVLQHIAAYQAAMQITTPMTDRNWDMLKPRILAEREQAELIEHRKAEQLAALQAVLPSTGADLTYQRPAKEVYDHEYEHAQEPFRKKLAEYADDFINGQWHGGQALDRDSVPLFAAQCLLFVRKRYIEEKQAQGLSQPNAGSEPGGSSRDSTPTEPFLSLDNVKWVQDNKIRPLADNHRREMFICSGCVDDRKPKWFAFEGLIQHYGAKHTTAFSKGNIVVHWQTAEWPDEAPFAEDPSHWLNQERRSKPTKERKYNPRGTPQIGHHGPFHSPKPPTVMLSELPFFSAPTHQTLPPSNGQLRTNYGYAPFQAAPAFQDAGSRGSATFQAPPLLPLEPAINFSHDTQLDKLVADATSIWNSLDGIQMILDCVRLQVVIHHSVQRFYEQFHQQPDLDLLTDGLATSPLMKPIKNITGLACKICVESQVDGSANYQSYYRRISNVKLYNPSSLITHFKIMHLANIPHLDWTKDMLELPEMQLVTELQRSPGMDDLKLALVAAAFPNAFSTPLRVVGQPNQLPTDPGPDSGLAKRLIDRLVKKDSQPKKKKGQHHGQNGTPVREASREPDRDEYDPTKPMIVHSREQELDPARFDTDLARASTASSKPVTNQYGLAPETLAALSNLTALTTQPIQAPAAFLESRSPSVCLPDSPRLTRPAATAAIPVGSSMPAETPNIASILAALQAQGHPLPTRTSTSSSTMRPTSALPQSPAEASQPAQHVPYREHREELRRSSSHYGPSGVHQYPTNPSLGHLGQDLQAVLSRPNHNVQTVMTGNAASYDNNRQTGYPGHQYPPAPRSPPHYQYVYDEARSAPAGPSPPHLVHAGPAPVQYVQREPARVEYRYEPAPPPNQIYIDQDGRRLQLVPIDAAPAPVQYLPHPFERQQQQQQQYSQAHQHQHQLQYYDRPPEQGHYGPPMPSHASPPYPQHGYYDQAQGPSVPPPQARYVYDDGGRPSVPRN